jgi:hypothetical protein
VSAGGRFLGDQGLDAGGVLDDLAGAVAARLGGDHHGSCGEPHSVDVGDDDELLTDVARAAPPRGATDPQQRVAGRRVAPRPRRALPAEPRQPAPQVLGELGERLGAVGLAAGDRLSSSRPQRWTIHVAASDPR